MTISYSGNYFRLLLRWRGSIWKAIWRELFVFLVLYFITRLIYTHALSAEQRTQFELISKLWDEYSKVIPITFLLGFYVATIVSRWWQQFNFVAWPDDFLSMICFVIPGKDYGSRLERHQIARYLNLTCALVWRDISVRVRRRFPTIDHVVQAGLMTSTELELYKSIQAESMKWTLPIQWVQKMVQNRLKDGKIAPPLASLLLKELAAYRNSFRKLYCYDWVCIPLVYTQVTALATYGYFLICIIGRQFLDPAKKYEYNQIDLVFPFFTVLQFMFYVGWFKVGQELMKPFGTDDDDIELNYLLNRHVQASFSMVNEVIFQDPPLAEDKFWGKGVINLGHTKLSARLAEHPPKLHVYEKAKKPEDETLLEEGDMTQADKKTEKKKRKETIQAF